jgi:PAS domain S-box-containing protein
MVLAGWALRLPGPISLAPDWPLMRVNTALSLLLAGVALWLSAPSRPGGPDPRPGPRAARSAQALGVLVGVAGLATLVQYLIGLDLGLDQLLLRDTLSPLGPMPPGRMAGATAANFAIVGGALALSHARRDWHQQIQTGMLVVLALAGLSLFGYLFGFGSFFRAVPVFSVALHTALSFVALAVGVLFLRPERGLAMVLLSPSAGGQLARRLVPLALLAPLGAGWLALRGEQAGLFDSQSAEALTSLVTSVLLASVIGLYATLLHRADLRGREAQEALHLSESRFRTLIENSSDAIALTDGNGAIIYLSPSTRQIEGYEPAELLGRSGLEHIHPDDLPGVQALVAELLANPGTPLPVLWRRQRKDGEWRSLEGVVVNLLHEPGVEAIVTNYRDVTDRVQAEAELAQKNAELVVLAQQMGQAAKLATMGELAASIAHELNNPLAIVSLRLEAALAAWPPDRPGRRGLEVAAEEAERMGRLVTELLAFSRRSPQHASTLDIVGEIEVTLDLVHSHLLRHNIEVEREYQPGLPPVQADRQQMRQILLNLFTNAADAMPAGGRLTVRACSENSHVVFEVTDTGAGFAPQEAPRLLEPFYTTKPEGRGTGLGLAVCRRIAVEHGGTFEIASPGAGLGATARVALPVPAGTNGPVLA